MQRNLHFWITVSILGLVVLFIAQNIVNVQVTLLFWTIELPRAILLFLVFGLGTLLGWILGSRAGSRDSDSGVNEAQD